MTVTLEKCSYPNFWNLWKCFLTWQKGLLPTLRYVAKWTERVVLKQSLAHQYSQWHYSQQPKTGKPTCLSNDNAQHGISTHRSTTQPRKAVTYRDKPQTRWTLKTPRAMKEASHKRPRTVWSHLYEATRTGKSTERRQVSGCQGLAVQEVKSEGAMLRGFPSGVTTMSATRQWRRLRNMVNGRSAAWGTCRAVYLLPHIRNDAICSFSAYLQKPLPSPHCLGQNQELPCPVTPHWPLHRAWRGQWSPLQKKTGSSWTFELWMPAHVKDSASHAQGRNRCGTERGTPQPLTQRSQRAFVLPDGLTAALEPQACTSKAARGSGVRRRSCRLNSQWWTTGCFPGLGVYTQNENSTVHLEITRNFSKEEWYCLSYLTWVRSKQTNFFLSLPLRERRWWAVSFLCIHSVRWEVLRDWLQPRLFLDQ